MLLYGHVSLTVGVRPCEKVGYLVIHEGLLSSPFEPKEEEELVKIEV